MSKRRRSAGETCVRRRDAALRLAWRREPITIPLLHKLWQFFEKYVRACGSELDEEILRIRSSKINCERKINRKDSRNLHYGEKFPEVLPVIHGIVRRACWHSEPPCCRSSRRHVCTPASRKRLSPFTHIVIHCRATEKGRMNIWMLPNFPSMKFLGDLWIVFLEIRRYCTLIRNWNTLRILKNILLKFPGKFVLHQRQFCNV